MENSLTPDILIEAYQDDIKQGFKNNKYQAEVRSALERLSVPSRIAFALLCAERSYPYYKTFADRYQPHCVHTVAEIINRIREHLLGISIGESETAQYKSFLEALSFEGPNPDYEAVTGPAIESINSICSALLACQNYSVDNAVSAAVASVYALDKLLMRRKVGVSYVSQSPAEVLQNQLWVAQDPLLVAELRKQAEILRNLRGYREFTENDLVLLRSLERSEKMN